MSQPRRSQPGPRRLRKVGAGERHDRHRSWWHALLVSTEPLPQHLRGAAIGRHAGRFRIAEGAITIVRRTLDARQSLTLWRRTERVEPAGRADQHDDDDEKYPKQTKEHTSQTGPGENEPWHRSNLGCVARRRRRD